MSEDDPFEVRTGSSASLDVQGYTFVLPSVSIGSVPQLAVDTLLSQQGEDAWCADQSLVHLCDLNHRFCIPFVGSGHNEVVLRTPLQVFAYPKARIAILQQRSPIIKERKLEFVASLESWIAQKKFNEVVILASLDAGLRNDQQME